MNIIIFACLFCSFYRYMYLFCKLCLSNCSCIHPYVFNFGCVYPLVHLCGMCGRCFGLLVSPGRNVKHSDMQLIEMVKTCRFVIITYFGDGMFCQNHARYCVLFAMHYTLCSTLSRKFGLSLYVIIHT